MRYWGDDDRAYAIEVIHDLGAEAERIKEENAKLRELVADLWNTAQAAARVGIDVGKEVGYERRMAELGIEVDE